MGDEAITMVRTNRECHPGGVKVVVVTETYVKALEKRAIQAERAKKQAIREKDDLAFRLRANKLAYISAAVLSSAAAWMIGYCM